MADNTAIEWTDATWNPITGCSIVSPGCKFCYAMRLAGTRLKHTPSRAGLTVDSKAGPVWNGQVRLNEQWLDQPLRWRRPRRIFVCAHGDLFAENVPDEWIDRVFAVMSLFPRHTFQVLTKRASRMREYVSAPDRFAKVLRSMYESVPFDGSLAKDWPLPNVWLGVSAERQQEAGERVPDLLATPAAIRFVSAEPLLGPIDFTRMRPHEDARVLGFPNLDALRGAWYVDGHRPEQEVREAEFSTIDWIIVGGESGPGARPMHPDWARSIRDQCQAAGVAFFFKQWGGYAPWQVTLPLSRLAFVASEGTVKYDPTKADLSLAIVQAENGHEAWQLMAAIGKKAAGRLLDGVEHNGFPELREVPFR